MRAHKKYDVAVIGLGGIGSAVVAACAQRGLGTAGFEQFGRGHDLGSSAGRTRMIRAAYYEHPAYVPLVLRAYDGWRQLERITGSKLLRITGLLMIGHAQSEVLSGSLKSARVHGLKVEQLDAAAVRARFPMFAIRDDEFAVYEANGGYIVPEDAVAAQLQVGERSGATLHFGTAQSVEQALERAAQVVLCAGAWMQGLDPQLPLSVERNVQLWFSPVDRAARMGNIPSFLIDRPEIARPLYGFPDHGYGVKAAFHGSEEIANPQSLRRSVDEGDIRPVRESLGDAIPDAAGDCVAGKACMYELTPDRHFVVSRHPQNDRVVIAGGFSGHGFKFAPAIGEAVADIVERRQSPFDLSLFSATRFLRKV